MPVCTHVDRHTLGAGEEIGAVIQVETAQEVLIGFAGAGMLGGDHAGNHLHQLAHAQHGHGQVVVAHPSVRRRRADADLRFGAAVDDDLFDRLVRVREALRGREAEQRCDDVALSSWHGHSPMKW